MPDLEPNANRRDEKENWKPKCCHEVHDTDDDIAGAEAAVSGKKEIDALVAYLQQLGTLLQTRR